MTNQTNKVLYVGVTNNLIRRIYEHKNKLGSSFTSKYNLIKLVYFEVYKTAFDAITREKQLKGGSRIKKNMLIEKTNPNYEDLYSKIV